MPRVRKEEYNEYMRNYMKKKNRENRGQPILEDDFDATNISGKPVLEINSAAKLVRETQKLLNKNPDYNGDENDPVLQTIAKYSKYIPLVVEFMKGFSGSVQQFNKQDQSPKIQPPHGWLNMTPMQRLNYKHTRAEWYNAGEAYDMMIETGNTNPQINHNYVDPTYGEPPQQNLRQLARKYPEPPLVKDSAPEVPVQEVQSVENKPTQESQLVSELQADNLKYIHLGAGFINGLTDKEFKDHLDHIDELILKAKPFIPLIPIQVKGMIVQTSKEDLETLFKEKCPAKYEMVVKKKKLEKLLLMFEELKKTISEEVK
ncbi:MAG: hypothetical protein WCV90_08995 [Candidatus Woesearchaeota archaeon]|jgi:hypothetical protein